MKRILFILTILLVGLDSVGAQEADGVKVENLRLKHSGDYMAVNMDVNFSDLDISSNRAVLFTPVLVNGNDSVELSSVGFYGRRRYFYYVRNDKSIIADENGKSYRASERPENMAYNAIVPFEKWMYGARLVLNRSEYGCCNKVIDEQNYELGLFKERVFDPEYVFLRPVAEAKKTRELCGSAYIDFVVNRTDIDPTYRNNKVELAKITATIDSVKRDNDITLTSLAINGFASPEGSYSSNTRLAKKRTDALKIYVQNLYDFAPGFIQTSYEPEDWTNLRKYVAASQLSNKEEILAVIDSERNADNKEWVIKSKFAADYNIMLTEYYPALRRSDYKVEYTIRSYSNVEEIKEIFANTPQKLSLDELYVLALQYDVNSREFSDVFETAVRMFPNDPIANLNAAITEMQNGDYVSAAIYLERAGDSPEAVYARGLYAAFVKEYDKAVTLLQQAQELGVAEAKDAIEQINEIR